MGSVREVFEASTDFTVGIEEEFAILDPETLSLDHRFAELQEAAAEDEVLADAVAGELIQSEIEIRSGRGEDLADAVARQREARARLFRLAADRDALLAATGTHPWSPWQDQRIIDTDHYHRVERDLQYVAWRNNTFSVHVHVGVRGADRALLVCDRLRARPARSCWRSRRTRRSSTGATPASTRRAPRSSRRASRAAGSPTPSAASGRTRTTWTSWCARARSSSTPRSGGASARTTPSGRSRCGSATPRRAPRARPRWRG